MIVEVNAPPAVLRTEKALITKKENMHRSSMSVEPKVITDSLDPVHDDDEEEDVDLSFNSTTFGTISGEESDNEDLRTPSPKLLTHGDEKRLQHRLPSPISSSSQTSRRGPGLRPRATTLSGPSPSAQRPIISSSSFQPQSSITISPRDDLDHFGSLSGSPRSHSGKRGRTRSRSRRSSNSSELRGGRAAVTSPSPSDTIVVMNLPFSLRREELEEYLDDDVCTACRTDLVMKEKQTGGFNGMAYIRFVDTVTAASALNFLVDRDIGGRKVRVEFSKDKEKHSSQEHHASAGTFTPRPRANTGPSSFTSLPSTPAHQATNGSFVGSFSSHSQRQGQHHHSHTHRSGSMSNKRDRSWSLRPTTAQQQYSPSKGGMTSNQFPGSTSYTPSRGIPVPFSPISSSMGQHSYHHHHSSSSVQREEMYVGSPLSATTTTSGGSGTSWMSHHRMSTRSSSCSSSHSSGLNSRHHSNHSTASSTTSTSPTHTSTATPTSTATNRTSSPSSSAQPLRQPMGPPTEQGRGFHRRSSSGGGHPSSVSLDDKRKRICAGAT